MEKNCLYCNEVFKGRKHQKFCSRKCSAKSQENKIEVACSYCGTKTLKQPCMLKDVKNSYCSPKCRDTHTGILQSKENHPMWSGGKVMIKFNCETCGKEHEHNKEHFQRSKSHYCSKECAYKGISEIYRGDRRYNYSMVTLNCTQCGAEVKKKPTRIKRNNHNFCSVECSAKWSSENLKGAKRYNYKPHLTDKEREKNKTRHSSVKYRKWMRDVMKNDDYTCVVTGIRGGDLQVHHLDGWHWCIEKRYDVSNGVTLRQEIHELFHKIYGLGDNTKEQFEEFKINYINNKVKGA